MANYKQFTALLSLVFLLSCSQSQHTAVRFGVIADIQYCDCEPRIGRYYKESLGKLDDCVAALNEAKVDFTINLGDLVDKEVPANLPAVLERLVRLDQEVYNTTGNHDYDGVTSLEALYKQLGMPEAYYSFVRKGWRFIMLNTNEVASYAFVENTPLQAELDEMRERIRSSNRPNGASYNGGVSKKQLDWLRRELESAEKKKEKVVVLSHHPLYAAPGLTALNDLEILEVLTSFSCVKAGISGHHHPGDFGLYEGIPFITLEGMVETEKNAYGIVTLTNDQLRLEGTGRIKSYTITFK